MSILLRTEIERHLEYGKRRGKGCADGFPFIEIDPFDPEQLNPASYDLRLGSTVVAYDFGGHAIYDVKREPRDFRHMEIGAEGFVIHPGRGYLMHTVERVRTYGCVPVLDGKSSVGRLFVSVHQTAGYGDPGFDGQYTLEVTTIYPVRLYAGMRIAQMRFHLASGCIDDPRNLYAGNYAGEAAAGPVPSRLWKQFGR
jgi:dCTP deaminase